MFPMLQPPAHGLEVLATELAHDVRRVALGARVGSALDPRSHPLDFVLDQGLPVVAVDVAFLAVEVRGIVALVSLHCLLVVEGLEAAFDVAWHGLGGLEWDDHLFGLTVDSVVSGWCSGWRVVGLCCVWCFLPVVVMLGIARDLVW